MATSCLKASGTAQPPHSPEQLLSLTGREFLPFTYAQPFDGQMHDPRTVELDHAIAQRLTHAPDLPVSSFGKNNPKLIGPDTRHTTRLRLASEDDDPT